MFTSFLIAFPLGLLLVIAAVVFAGFKFLAARKVGLPATNPIVINPGAALSAIRLARAGNPAAALQAATQSLQLHLADGSIEQKLMQLAFKEIERRAADPNAPLPVIDYVTHFSGQPRNLVIAAFEAEAGIVPAQLAQPVNPAAAVAAVATAAAAAPTSPPSVPAAAPLTAAAAPLAAGAVLMIALLLTASSSASAASPLTPPAPWVPRDPHIVIDAPVFGGPLDQVQRGNLLLPQSWQPQAAEAPIAGIAQQPTASCQANCQGSAAPRYFQGLSVPSATGQIAAPCRLPDKGPTIFIHYYFAPWCSGCAEGNDATQALADAGWKVLAFNTDSDTGYVWARVDKVQFVPYWIVTSDGRETLRTSNHRTLFDHLSRLRQQQPRYGVSSQWSGFSSQCAATSYSSGPVGWWQRGPVRRWFAFRGPVRRWIFRGRC